MNETAPFASDAAASVPKLMVAGGLATFASDLDLIIKVLGLVYIIMQIGFLAHRWLLIRRTKKDQE